MSRIWTIGNLGGVRLPLGAVLVVALVAAMGCTSTAPAPSTKTVKPSTKADDPTVRTVSVKIVAHEGTWGKFVVWDQEVSKPDLVEYLLQQKASLRPSQTMNVEVQAAPDACYAALGQFFLACGEAEIENLSLNGQVIKLPLTTALAGGKALSQRAIVIKAFDIGPQGEFVPGGTNESCSLHISSAAAGTSFKFEVPEKKSKDSPAGAAKKPAKPLPKVADEDRDIGMDFGALLAILKKDVQDGMPVNTPVLIKPTLGCRCKWVLKTAEAVKSAGLTETQFVISYYDDWE